MWGHAPRGAGFEGESTHTFNHLKRVLSRNLDQNGPKNAYFMEKSC